MSWPILSVTTFLPLVGALFIMLVKGEERLAKEAQSRQKLRNGELGLDFYGLRAKLTELGVEWKDDGD